jgi:ribosomal protein L21E
MKSDFSLGDRVRISALGATRSPRLAGKTGTVVGRSIFVSSVAVLLDGNKSPTTIHGSYLEAVTGHVNATTPPSGV